MNLKPDVDRLAETIEELGRFGALPGGGVTRQELTPEDAQAVAYLTGLMEGAGLTVRHDPAANLVGRRAGSLGDSAPAVLTGSHRDSGLQCGRYDGALGVLAAIEAVRLLDEKGVATAHPIEVIAFSGEEMSRFGVGTKGSRAIVGRLTPPAMRALVDANGVSYWEALAAAGCRPEELSSRLRTRDNTKCFVELHVEQGPVLEESGKTIGVVTALAGMTHLWTTISGAADHAGATPMHMRRDAFAAAAELALALEEEAVSQGKNAAVATVGDVRVQPGSTVIIPGHVEMSGDIRSTDETVKQRIVTRFRDACRSIGERRGVQVDCRTVIDEPALALSPQIRDAVEATCSQLGIPAMRMPSAANHDARHIAAVTEAGMIFVPSVNGISHAPDEYTTIEDACVGVEVLAHVLLHLAQEDT